MKTLELFAFPAILPDLARSGEFPRESPLDRRRGHVRALLIQGQKGEFVPPPRELEHRSDPKGKSGTERERQKVLRSEGVT